MGEITISFLIPISCELKGLKKPWGHKKGAHEHALLFISFIFNLLGCVLSPAFAPKACKWTSIEVFFMSEIRATQGFPRFFLQLKSI
ncbi:hypothetical protein DSQ53_15130 [Salmonella enterica]|nr:hypothetical protein [Salmonella enterica]